MQVSIIDEARDEGDTYEISFVAKEKGGLLLVAPPLTIFIDPFEVLAENVVELVGQSDLPEPRRPERVHSFEELLASLAGAR